MRFLLIFIFAAFVAISCGDSVALHLIEDPPTELSLPCLDETVRINHPTQTEDLLVILELAQHGRPENTAARLAVFTLKDLTVGLEMTTPPLHIGEEFGPLTMKDVSMDGDFVVSYCLTKR